MNSRTLKYHPLLGGKGAETLYTSPCPSLAVLESGRGEIQARILSKKCQHAPLPPQGPCAGRATRKQVKTGYRSRPRRPPGIHWVSLRLSEWFCHLQMPLFGNTVLWEVRLPTSTHRPNALVNLTNLGRFPDSAGGFPTTRHTGIQRCWSS